MKCTDVFRNVFKSYMRVRLGTNQLGQAKDILATF